MAFTYFFRDLHTLEIAVKYVVPEITGRMRARVWDAGCALGQEAYTLAILFAENMGKFAFKNLHIHATDMDSSNLFGKTIVSGIYPYAMLKRIPQSLFAKYFHHTDKSDLYRIHETLRNRIHFQKHDLLTLEPVGNGFSLIVCKNVLLHFQPYERIAVIKMFHKSLLPGGFFVTEQTQKLPQKLAPLFQQMTTDAQVFRKI